MTIQDKNILEHFQIDVYEDQYVLREVKPIDINHRLSKGEEGEKEVTHGYFVSLDALIRKMIQIKLSREEGTMTLKEFWTAWVNHNKKVVDLIESLNLPVKQYTVNLPVDENVEI
jgi:hypothetical protein